MRCYHKPKLVGKGLGPFLPNRLDEIGGGSDGQQRESSDTYIGRCPDRKAYGLGYGIKARFIIGMLGSQHPIPPCEIETEIAVALTMVQVVMGCCRDPADKFIARPASGE